MIDIEMYIKNPCRESALPYWKEKDIKLPVNMKVLHEEDFDDIFLENYNDVPYFRLLHSMDIINNELIDGYYIKTATIDDITIIVDIINKSYLDISVTKEQIYSYTHTQVYNKDLWILVYDKETNEVVGCGIADVDNEIQEGILEWIQVLPQYRNKGIGKFIVNELLRRMRNIAKFVTVSGQVENKTNPEGLYRKCGFKGKDIWHVMQRK
ncbi:GNAT family N-acetyltransferase [Sedimentibacter sp. zth1]|uniref:GNAT family N-acetyltransferase n=1 Tax=Sedimentibacter sp. zth1 TaxID=2816908 RepID=UPI001A935581|nr:GNAT family N-acetyltransferase [Sedimentibacter sp. zth1]QSX06684.1 GNAT family N-acetyltransferase [Sedimentibacter sp. zth1]